MAGIAGLAVVGIAGDITVFGVNSALGMGMAVDARKLLKIIGRVTIGAYQTRMFSRLDRKIVDEDSLRPGGMGRVMTGVAGRGKSGCLVVGIGRVIVVSCVTTVAILGQVIALAVASVAIEGLMGTLERPVLGMIDVGILPAAGSVTVAGHAIRRKAGLGMVRVSGAVVIRKMAGNAG
jgi:hypothetical protein